MIVYIHAMGVVSGIVDEYIYLFPAMDSVSMFFVLSGYLIGRILIKTFVERTGDTRSLGQFWIYRWFRTLPNYYLILTVLVVVSSLNGSGSDAPVGPFFIFSQNIAWKHPSFFGEAWSLAVEEWFYLLMPLLMIGAMWRSPSVAASRRRLIVLLAVVALASIAARLPAGLGGHVVTYEDWDSMMRKVVVGRFDALAIGVFGAYLSIYRTDLWTRNTRLLAVAGVVLIVLDRHVLCRYVPYAIYGSLTVVPLSTLLMMPYLSQLSCRRNIITDAIEWISRRSYSMYLVNLSLTYLILSYLPFEWAGSQAIAVKYLTYWIIVVGISAGLYRLWEMPMMNLRTRFRWSTPAHAFGVNAVPAAPKTVDAGEGLPAGLQRAN
ncbi:Peptidoglycan/LPS O-acetylase OafA/YrhL, contains acyltransferase and SGNH-hydrolase domains [Kaistia soli DSM 19436]|uniref:Peptidoglycan/LPS O-acetylase OafA/YrhL, contains acyltransferase and SGNH-hydrolase domains n=2 Tax=Kaistia TaxID=166953 RepID=A0A1M5A1G2_9HYPH|nr:Peptidoglycan/LPS O-acetylase OafA/YrhL, contains acyltransferase and SGNH-hydrolase domains [Kaistia soli DSM 19436]